MKTEALLLKSSDAVTRLEDLLQQESELLRLDDPEGLAGLVEKKHSVLEKLTHLNNDWLNLANRDSAKKLSPAETSSWETLQARLQKCQDLNRDLSVIVTAKLRHTSLAINMLYKLLQIDTAEWYEASGEKGRPPLGSELACV